MKKTNTGIISTGFGGMLQLVFIVLKLCKVIDWKWLWVLSPMWIGAGIAVIAIVLLIIAIKKQWL